MKGPRKTTALAHRLRAAETPAERKLWRLLRSRRLAALKWRRQFPIGLYVVDFVCLEKRIVVECDGSLQGESNRDVIRDAWLADQGSEVLRFWNHAVLQLPVSVTDTILARSGQPF